MRAVLCRAFGPPESLTVEDLPDPTPGPGTVLVDVACTALNFFDTLIIQNRYQVRPELPFSPGAEFAGRVAALGEGVQGFEIGQRVAGYVGYGACRTKVVAPVGRLIPVPDGLSDEVAAGLLVTYGTSLHALQDRARLQPGETLAVLGAAGGVGLAAIEIAKALGARVIACASSDEKLAACREHGADETINYVSDDLRKRVDALTGGKGADVVYDPVGGAFTELALRSCAWRGRLLVIGFASGEIPKIPLNLALLKGCSIVGVFWGAFAKREPEAFAESIAGLARWYGEGKLRPHITATFPLERAAEALSRMAGRTVVGKVVLTV
jgi:NADPH:quinone reductase